MSLLGAGRKRLRAKTAGKEARRGEKPTRAPGEAEQSLALLAEGAVQAVPEIDAKACQELRGKAKQVAAQLGCALPDGEQVSAVRSLVELFGEHRKGAESELGGRLSGWRAVAELLLRDLLKSLGISENAASAAQLFQRIAGASSATEIERLNEAIERFFHPKGAGSSPAEALNFRKADHSTENDNAAGLRGGGRAVEDLRRIMESGGRGFIVLFRLSCLNMIHQRFGAEAVEDCLMAVAAFLTQSLHSDDTTYHWSDASLLSILQGRVNEQILRAELERIVLKNRETCVNIGGRATMLRIPITFDITPIDQLETAEDLLKINLLCHSGGSR
jgi:GGDEF domain-containing protein